jgi:hypothetical protein
MYHFFTFSRQIFVSEIWVKGIFIVIRGKIRKLSKYLYKQDRKAGRIIKTEI